VGINMKKPVSAASEVVDNIQIFVSLKGLIDLSEEKKRQLNHIKKLESHLDIVRKKLFNENFIKNAPVSIVNAEKDKEMELLGQINKVKEILDDLQKDDLV